MTLNAALDVTYAVDGVDWNGVNRVHAVHRRAGGKGVNVARVLAALGHEVVVAGLAGGATGTAIEADLAVAGLPSALTPIAADSRSTLVITGRRTAAGQDPGGDSKAVPLGAGQAPFTALFNEPGPEVTLTDLDRFITTFHELIAGADAVVLSGSLPRGVPTDFYATLAAHARERGVPAIVDADGEPLRLAPPGRPSIIKPNAEELARALATAPLSRQPGAKPDTLAGAEVLRRAGAESVVVSMGAEGLVAVTPDGSWRARMPYAVHGNPTGAGDALVAGLALGLAGETPWPDRLRTAAALGAAAVATPVAGEIDFEVYRNIHPQIGVEACPW
ncbi:1-phosphofructokinase family hexose kinase [Sphaerisporangium fuscum]|uniref:1-phosphofructokinase family hexose kinase n=1 Tax=Sphaerisporangium fuscum TaxID=2835868 RepID=UPI0027E28FD7|nr:1-phosphofructokinase family hexose kinase [Sphaerisporangium fuscum]